MGGVLRWGYHLPDNFGPSRPSASDGNSFISSSKGTPNVQTRYSLFAGARGNYLVRNIFLDGNTFESSHRVQKYPIVVENDFGVELTADGWTIVWSFVTRSPEYQKQKTVSSFASLNFVYAL